MMYELRWMSNNIILKEITEIHCTGIMNELTEDWRNSSIYSIASDFILQLYITNWKQYLVATVSLIDIYSHHVLYTVLYSSMSLSYSILAVILFLSHCATVCLLCTLVFYHEHKVLKHATSLAVSSTPLNLP